MDRWPHGTTAICCGLLKHTMQEGNPRGEEKSSEAILPMQSPVGTQSKFLFGDLTVGGSHTLDRPLGADFGVTGRSEELLASPSPGSDNGSCPLPRGFRLSFMRSKKFRKECVSTAASQRHRSDRYLPTWKAELTATGCVSERTVVSRGKPGSLIVAGVSRKMA